MVQMGAEKTPEGESSKSSTSGLASRSASRWYLVHAPKREQSTCDKLRKVLPEDLWDDMFVMKRERWRKLNGEWKKRLVQMYPDYFIVATRNPKKLDREMAKLSFGARIAQNERGRFAPLSLEAQEWYEEMLDDMHVIRTSTAAMVGGELQVQNGPLAGQESRVVKLDRRGRQCLVGVGDGDNGFTECVPLLILVEL